MHRALLAGCLAALVWGLGSQSACAQEELNHKIEEGLVVVTQDWSAWLQSDVLTVLLDALKVAMLIGLYLAWVNSSDWVNRDRFERRASKGWNLAMLLPFILFFLLFMLMFWWSMFFWIGYPLMCLAYFVPFIIYVVNRNGKVEMDDRVFTKKHLRYWFLTRLQQIGMKVDAEEKGFDDIGPPVKLSARGGATERDDNVNLLTARQSPGYLTAREMLAEAFNNRAMAAMLDYTQSSVAVRFQVDGVWHPGEAMEREPGDMMLAVLKTISALNANDRRNRQSGVFGAEFEKQKRACRLTSQGTQTGERVLLQFEDPDVKSKRPLDLGMRQKMLDELKPVLETKNGLIIVSAPPNGGGLTCVFHAILGCMDRYTRGFISIEDSAAKELEVENIVGHTVDGAAGQTPATVLPKLLREYPDVIVVPDMKDAESARLLCEQAVGDRTVITTARAKEACEALLRVAQLKMPLDQLASAVKVVINQRMVRKLCDKCKEAYPPPPQLLQQLGIPPGRVEALYRPPTPDPEKPQEPCEQCHGIGYYGRTGIFETLIVTDEVRAALKKTPQLNAMRQAARKAGMRVLQEEGVLLVVTGVTSLPELMRALKE
jgi:type II secretory ATPase GspE/PulE/Tfp pilus assembly ATPase PilB-like protein